MRPLRGRPLCSSGSPAPSQPNLPPEMRPQAEKLRRVTAAWEHLRRIATELRPIILQDLWPAEALRWQIEGFQKQTGLPVALQIQGRIEWLPRQVGLVLCWVAQEALTNIARHARATCMEIAFWYILERADDTLKVGGKRLGPAEIESVLVEHAAVTGAAVIGVPDEIKGETPVARVIPRPGYRAQ
ncbi:MAG: hypothetical protein J7452_04375 [Thermoflexus sp.]|nr:hypothetical protein [Thermoflexus sp.]